MLKRCLFAYVLFIISPSERQREKQQKRPFSAIFRKTINWSFILWKILIFLILHFQMLYLFIRIHALWTYLCAADKMWLYEHWTRIHVYLDRFMKHKQFWAFQKIIPSPKQKERKFCFATQICLAKGKMSEFLIKYKTKNGSLHKDLSSIVLQNIYQREKSSKYTKAKKIKVKTLSIWALKAPPTP